MSIDGQELNFTGTSKSSLINDENFSGKSTSDIEPTSYLELSYDNPEHSNAEYNQTQGTAILNQWNAEFCVGIEHVPKMIAVYDTPEQCNNLNYDLPESSAINDRAVEPQNSSYQESDSLAYEIKDVKVPNKSKSRKRKVDIHLWKDVKAKEARNRGTQGVGRKGVIKAREMKAGCSTKCRFNCRSKITTEERNSAFTQFWALGDHAKQWICLSKWVTRRAMKKNDGSESDYEGDSDNAEGPKEKFKHIFTLPTANGQTVGVCKKMFLETLDISYQWIRTADAKCDPMNSTNMIVGDRRGKHSTRPCKITERARCYVKEHIESFPIVDLYYCKDYSEKKYLEEGLSISKMYRMYVDKRRSEQDENIVSHQIYDKIFNNDYGYRFFKPKKDKCELCEKFKTLSESDKTQVEDNYNLHNENKKTVRNLMRTDKIRAANNTTICTINFDTQKVLSTPRTEIDPLYYMCKLSIWNFTIFELGAQIGWCNLWNETIGSKGSDEIASFLWQFIQRKSEAGIQEFALYCNNCGGLNRNKNVFSMLFKAANQFEVKITQRFLEAGHTQCDGDTMISRIQKHCMHKSVFTQEEWMRLIREANPQNPYNVEQKSQDQILNFEDLSNLFNWFLIDIPNLRELVIIPKQEEIEVKYEFKNTLQKISILIDNVCIADIFSYELKAIKTIKNPLSIKKKQDLLAMIKHGFIPDEFKEFYLKIITN